MPNKSEHYMVGERWLGCPHKGLYRADDWPGCEVCDPQGDDADAEPYVTTCDHSTGTVTFESVLRSKK